MYHRHNLSRILLFLIPVLSIPGFGLQAFTRVDTLLTMSDDVQLSVSYWKPEGTAPAEGWPGIISAHGFAGSRNSNAFLAEEYADSGYAALTWTIRGQGRGGATDLESEGTFNWFTGEREIRDVEEIILWFGSRSFVNAERIGLEGISQGGLTTWGAVINQLPVRCAISMASVPHYTRSMAHNGCNNYFTMNALLLARTLGLVNMGPFIGDSLYRAYETDNHAEVLRLLSSKELIDRVPDIQVPVFAQLAWQDDLFGPASLFRTFSSAQAPMKLLVVPGNHSTIAESLLSYRLRQSFRFYRYWLRDDRTETIMHSDSIVTLVAGGDTTFYHLGRDQVASFVPDPFGQGTGLHLYFNTGGKLTSALPTTAVSFSKLYIQNITNDHTIFRSTPLSEPLTIKGAETSFTAGSSATKWQVNLLLWDHDPEANAWRPITRGSWEVRNGGAERRIEYQLTPQLYTIPAGHVLEARVKFGLPLSVPADEFGQIPGAPQETALTTFSGPTDNPAYIRLLIPEAGSSTTPDIAGTADHTHLHITGNVFRKNGGITFSVQGTSQRAARVVLIDVLGRTLLEQPARTGQSAIQGEGLLPGVYALRLLSGKEVLDQEMIILQ